MTTTVNQTVQQQGDLANPNTLADFLRLVALGHFFANLKVTFAALTSAAAQDVTTAAAKAAATISGLSLDTGENLPAIGVVKTLRVTAGAAAAGARFVTDAGGTPSTTVATLSDDGKTLTFEAAVTGFVVEYQPRSGVDMTATWADFI